MIHSADVGNPSTSDGGLSATRYTQQKAPDAVVRVAALVGREASVLEIGPATGNLTRIISVDQRCEVTAIEIDAAAAERVRPLCKQTHVADLESVELATLLGDQKFDVVTFGDVLEHLRSPVAALKKVKPFIADGGCVVLSVPNIAHASVVYELAHGRFDYRPTGLLDVTHIRFFTRKSLLQLIDDANYVVVHFDRVVVSPEQTEFKTRIHSLEQHNFMHFLQSANPESSTYQFIVRIIPRAGEGPYVSEALIPEMVQEMERLKDQLGVQRKRVNQLESHLKWIEDRWPMRWAQRLKGLVSSR